MKPILYFPNFLTELQSFGLMTDTLDKYELTPDKYNFGGKEVLSPRLIAFLSKDNKKYTYSGQTRKSYNYSESIEKLVEYIEAYLNEKGLKLKNGYFNGCLLNLYRNGNDSISYHKDNEKDMSENTYIAVISVGAERTFKIKNDLTGKVENFVLENGSLCVMTPVCQKEYKHGIMKEKGIQTPRLSFTFRNFK